MIPLNLINPGEKVKIIKIIGGRNIHKRLSDMGFLSGTVIEVISNVGFGPLIVSKNGVKLGLGFGMAHKIFVSPFKENENCEKK